MTKLYLVGTHHLDLKGPERLEKFLGFVRPDTIGLESTIEDYHRRIKDHEQFNSQKLLFRCSLRTQFYDSSSIDGRDDFIRPMHGCASQQSDTHSF